MPEQQEANLLRISINSHRRPSKLLVEDRTLVVWRGMEKEVGALRDRVHAIKLANNRRLHPS